MDAPNGSYVGGGSQTLPKVATGNPGLDKILLGGLPAGRMTLLTGSAGCGKTLIGMEYLVRGAGAGEAGILVPFEERTEAVRTNALTLGWDLAAIERERRLFVVDARPDYGTVISGDFDIKGLLTIIDGVARDIGARRGSWSGDLPRWSPSSAAKGARDLRVMNFWTTSLIA